MTEQAKPSRLLRLPAVEDRVGLKRTVIYKRIKQGQFPSPVKITERASGWRESEIDAWIASRQPAQLAA